MSATKIGCPHCHSELHLAEIVPDGGYHYLRLKCNRCRNELLFRVDLSPNFLEAAPLPSRQSIRKLMRDER
jgi:prepilin signal peptidase PulO-like enzyme (type II secretory pathway)